MATIGVFVVLLVAVSQPVIAASDDTPVLQFWYRWAFDNRTAGGEPWTLGATNLTLRVNVTEANGSQVEEINEFLVQAATPGRRVNESSAFLRPQISAVYNTLQIRRGSGCMPTNGTCDPRNITWEQRVLWEHQVLEIRFLRLVEFGDSDGDGGYTPGEPILSQLDLADPAFPLRGGRPRRTEFDARVSGPSRTDSLSRLWLGGLVASERTGIQRFRRADVPDVRDGTRECDDRRVSVVSPSGVPRS